MANRYVWKRLGQALLVFWLSISVTFVMYRLMPGNPVEVLRGKYIANAVQQGQQLTDAKMAEINARVRLATNLDPEKPIPIAYYEYFRDIILYQDFGESINKGKPVFEILFSAMPWSVFISIYGLALGTSTSLLLGALMAHREGGKFDIGMSFISTLTMSIPYYLVAIALILVFALELSWLPSAGKYDFVETTPGFNLPFMVSVVKHGTLPILSAFIASFGGSLAFRGNCIREKGKEYTKVAKLRGISESRLAIRYIGRNSLLPVYTGIMLGLSGLFSSSIILEIMFNYKAMGFATYGALMDRDYPLLMGAFIFYTGITVLGIFIADMTYGIIDPRVRGGGERETY